MFEEDEAIAQKIPDIQPDHIPPPVPKSTEKTILVTSDETKSSQSKITGLKKEVHNMTQKRLAAGIKGR